MTIAPAGTTALREPGPLLFARFALPPNHLGYCGGDETASLLQHLDAGVVDDDLVRQCRDFEGAYPYLQLIADQVGIADPLDRAAVEAYWVGTPALASVGAGAFAADLTSRFRSRASKRDWAWLASKPAGGAVPHHSFHVLEVLPRIGMIRGGLPPALVPVLERCLVRPARVAAVEGDLLRVTAPRLLLVDGKLRFVRGGGDEHVRWRIGGTELVAAPCSGEHVAIHWDWACDRLTTTGARRLRLETDAALKRANTTL